MPKLIMIAPAPVKTLTNDTYRLDVKFVEGMRLHVAQWNGDVICMLREGTHAIPFGATYHANDLDFDLRVLAHDAPIDLGMATAGDLIFAAADMFDVFQIADPQNRAAGVKLVYSIEYDLETRFDIVDLDRSKNRLRKLWTKRWLRRTETQRRNGLRLADGVQANGYPAFAAYSAMNDNTMLYLDGRMKQDMFASKEDQQNRHALLSGGAALRLVHSGRLETMKGAQDLIPLARRLRDRSVNFTFDIFGGGSLADEMAEEIAASGLSDIVNLHPPVDFETELVPFFRRNADLFVSCHRQSDPSCTYIETLGCGVPVVGYANRMWQEVAKRSNAGWYAPLGDADALADKIVTLAADRDTIAEASDRALAFSQAHAFEIEFSKRMAHLKDVANTDKPDK